MGKTYQPLMFVVLFLVAVFFLDAGREKITGKDVDDLALAEDIRENILDDVPTFERSARSFLQNPGVDSVLQAPPSGGNTQAAACKTTELLDYTLQRLRSSGGIYPYPLDTYTFKIDMDANLVAYDVLFDIGRNSKTMLHIVPLGADGRPDPQDPLPISFDARASYIADLDVHDNRVFWILRGTTSGSGSVNVCTHRVPPSGQGPYPLPLKGDCYSTEPITLYTPPAQSSLIVGGFVIANSDFVFWEMYDRTTNNFLIYSCAFKDIDPEKGCTNVQPLPLTYGSPGQGPWTYDLAATRDNLYVHINGLVPNNLYRHQIFNYYLPTKTVTTLFDHTSQQSNWAIDDNIEAFSAQQPDLDFLFINTYEKIPPSTERSILFLPVKQGKAIPPWVELISPRTGQDVYEFGGTRDAFLNFAYYGRDLTTIREEILGLYSPSRHLLIPLRTLGIGNYLPGDMVNDARGNVVYHSEKPYHSFCS